MHRQRRISIHCIKTTIPRLPDTVRCGRSTAVLADIKAAEKWKGQGAIKMYEVRRRKRARNEGRPRDLEIENFSWMRSRQVAF